MVKGGKKEEQETLRYANANVKYTPSTRIRKNKFVPRITQATAWIATKDEVIADNYGGWKYK